MRRSKTEEARPQVPGRARGEGKLWVFCRASMSLTTHTQPYHLATHLPQQRLRGGQMDLLWCPTNDPIPGL